MPERPFSRSLSAAILSAPVFALMVAACGSGPDSDTGGPAGDGSTQEAPTFTNLESGVAFVGDDACFDCHESEYRGYHEHGMANSVYRLTAETRIEDFDGVAVRDTSLGYRYTVFERDGSYYQEEFLLDEAGRKTHSQVREMQFVIGSGISARSYLTWEDGWLYQLPLTWYVQQRTWDFSPGYQIANKRFDRKILPRCLTCHDAYPDEVPFTDGKYTSVPLGISCERCHGPGGEHVEARLAIPEPDSVDRSIVNPAHLSLERRLDVCQQCHLNPTISILRKGRTPYDYRPSQDLKDYLSLYEVEEPETHEEIGLTSHVGRMKASACYVGSLAAGQPLECTTCHNPHSGFRSAGPEYFNATCRTCHPPDGLRAALRESASLTVHDAAANCISCHMPKADIAKVAHANFTDHWIRVVDPEAARPAASASDPPPLIALFERDADRDAEGGVYEGMAYVVYGTQQQNTAYLERGAEILADALSPESDFGEAHFLQGLAYTQLGRNEEAIEPLERAVTLDAGIPERLNALAQAYEATGRDPLRVQRLYERALAIQPARADIRVNYGRFLEARGRTEEAIAAYRAAILEEPWFATAHYNLGTALLRAGDPEQAEKKLKDALSLDPRDPESWGNLGILYASAGREGEALAAFENAVEVAPKNPVALGNLGAHHLQKDELEAAIPLLERAVEAAPDYLDGRVNLALAYFRDDQFERARTQAEAALRIVPENELARQILGAL